MAQKEADNIAYEVSKPIDNETLQIRDLRRWLSDRENSKNIQMTFHKVFDQSSFTKPPPQSAGRKEEKDVNPLDASMKRSDSAHQEASASPTRGGAKSRE